MIKNNGSTKSFVLEYETGLTKKDRDICEKKLRIGRQIYNAFLSECIRRIKSYKNDLRFQETAKEYQKAKKDRNFDKVKHLSKEMDEIKQSHGWAGEFSLADFRKKQSEHFSNSLGASVVTALSFRAYRTARKYEKGEIRKVRFVNDNENFSIESQTNKAALYFKNNYIYFNKKSFIPVKEKENTPKEYYDEALKNRIKYCRLLSRSIRGKKRYYVQLILEGTPPNNREYGDGEIVIHDVGLSQVELSINGKKRLIDLAPECVADEEKESNLMRKIESSRRTMNPDNYTTRGAIKKGAKDWKYSKNYKKLVDQYNELRRKEAATRKNSHERLTNELLAQGSNIIIEQQSYKEFVKMNKDVNSHGATKKQNQTILNKAPGEFVKLLERKLGYIDKELIKKQKK